MSTWSSKGYPWWYRLPMVLAVACFIGMLVAAAKHAGAAAIVLLLFVVFFLSGWIVLIVGVLRLKRDVGQLVRERQQGTGL